jgi:hypothetical protein
MADFDDPVFVARLRAVVDRIIPADADPGALELGTDGFVLAELRRDAAALAAAIEAGLDGLFAEAAARFSVPFDRLPVEDRDELLAEIADAPWFVALAELTAEGFYADPANGGNRDARSWSMIGYAHRLPDGPSGRLAPIAREPE